MSSFVATPTMEEFMLSKAFVRVLGGPIGGGKSVCCLHDLFLWASEQAANEKGERKTRFLIIRNTADQLRSTVQKSLHDWFPPGQAGTWKASEKTMYFDLPLADGTRMKSEWMLIALDTPDDVRKALSLEATGIWGNEARELHPEVVEALLGRVDRYPSMKDGGATRAGAIFDTNMPDVDTWWHEKMENAPTNWSVHVQPPAIISMDQYLDKYREEPEEERTAVAFDGTEYVSNPEADNYDHLSKTYYANNIPGKSADFIDVFLRCRYGRALNGTPVYDGTFIPEFHITDHLTPIKAENYPITIGLDFGRTPAAIFGQLDHRGRIMVFDELISENMGLEKFITTKLKPLIYEKYAGYPIIIAPDPAGWAKTQVTETSPVDVLKREGFKVVGRERLTNNVEPRIQSVERMLTRQVDGKAGFLISANCSSLIKGFKYGYRWKVDKKGNIQDKSPDKNEFSHPHDALQYLAQIVDSGVSGSTMGRRREIQPAPIRWAI